MMRGFFLSDSFEPYFFLAAFFLAAFFLGAAFFFGAAFLAAFFFVAIFVEFRVSKKTYLGKNKYFFLPNKFFMHQLQQGQRTR
jgi:hypothetical protein